MSYVQEPHEEPYHLELRLPVRAQSVATARRAAAQFAEETGCTDLTLWRVRLAVSEAISNVVLHAHEPEDAQLAHLTLSATADDEQITMTVADVGTGLRPRRDSPGMGLGLALIAKSCDAFELDTGAAGGTVVRMTFRR